MPEDLTILLTLLTPFFFLVDLGGTNLIRIIYYPFHALCQLVLSPLSQVPSFFRSSCFRSSKYFAFISYRMKKKQASLVIGSSFLPIGLLGTSSLMSLLNPKMSDI